MRTSPILSIAAALPVFLAACGGGGGDGAGEPVASCQEQPTAAVYQTAFAEYLKGITPTPRRFLNPVGTDSALPDPMFSAVQQKGPSYLYPTDSAGQQVVLEKLGSVGSWSTLLVSWRGLEVVDDTTARIRLGGGFVGGDDHGTPAPSRSLYFACDTVPWRFTRMAEESAS